MVTVSHHNRHRHRRHHGHPHHRRLDIQHQSVHLVGGGIEPVCTA